MRKQIIFRTAACLLLISQLLTACNVVITPKPDTAPTTTEPARTEAPSTTAPVTTEPSDPPAPIEGALLISEVVADNRCLYGGFPDDWIELYNPSESAVTLDGYSLSDDPTRPDRCPLDGRSIGPDSYLLIRLPADGKLGLSSLGETVYLMHGEVILDRLTYTEAIEQGSWTSEGATDLVTPGFPNTAAGYEAYLSSVTLPKELIISEAVTSNSKTHPVAGNYYDWIELYNNSDTVIELSRYTVSDKYKEPDRCTLPSVALMPGDYYVLSCSGLSKEGHAPFKLSASGETVWLFRDGIPIDCLVLPGDLEKDKSYGRSGNETVYLDTPTPGKANSSGTRRRLAPPAASLDSGLYADALRITLTGDGTIFYTTDGTHPTTASPVYRGPISVSANTTVRAFCRTENAVSETASYTYLIGLPDHSLPILTLNVPDSAISGPGSVIEAITQDIEAEGNLTLFTDGEVAFTVPCGFKLHGNDSRKCAKQNFTLHFRSAYGAGKLKYRVFEDLEIDEFNSLLLKGGSEDYNLSMIRDELGTALAGDGTALYVQASRPVVLYLNGQYWGIYFIRERFSEDYVASHLNVDKSSVDLLHTYSSVQAGSAAAYNALLSYVTRHNLATDQEAYQYVLSQIDEESLMDWYICRTYMGDKDYANIRYFRSTEYDSQWRWMYFDLDWAFCHTDDTPLTDLIQNNGRHILMYGLLKNAEFRDRFLKRYATIISTALATDHILERIDWFENMMQSEIARDRARWNLSVKAWQNQMERIRAYFRNDVRREHVLQDIQRFFKLTDEQMKAYFG